MRHLPAWASNKLRLGIVLCLAIGAIAIVWDWRGPGAQESAGSQTVLEQPIGDLIELDAPSPPTSTDTPGLPSTVIVYISGAVRAPDVYELPREARIKDLVLAAGGLAADAAPDRINLAERLKDSDHIHMPRAGEIAEAETVNIAGEAQDGLLDINTASAADLEELPGVGASIAERIIEHRSANGPFKSVEDLRSVKGIGPALFAKIAPLTTVGP